MKVGDVVMDDFYDSIGLVTSSPRLSQDCDFVRFGGDDTYWIVDVLLLDGTTRVLTTDELAVVSEAKDVLSKER